MARRSCRGRSPEPTLPRPTTSPKPCRAPVGPFARVRRRRRILLGIGGAAARYRAGLRALVRAGVPRAGSARSAVVVTVQQGESTSAVVTALSQQHVIGSAAGLPAPEVVHGTPTVLPGSYAFAPELGLLFKSGSSWPPDPTSTRSMSVQASRFSEVAQEVGSVPATASAASRRPPPAAPCSRPSPRPARTIWRACSARASTTSSPARATPPS